MCLNLQSFVFRQTGNTLWRSEADSTVQLQRCLWLRGISQPHTSCDLVPVNTAQQHRQTAGKLTAYNNDKKKKKSK